MKYLKKFENANTEYKIGDFIIYNSEPYEIYYTSMSIEYDMILYHCNNLLNNYKELLYINDINRKMTPEEIEEYNMKKDSSKYNL